MAQEITPNCALTFTKGNISLQISKSGPRFDVAGKNYVRKSQAIGLAAEALDLGDIGTPGWFYVQNNDATNYVELLDATGGAVFAKLKPGEFIMGRFGCAAPAAKANTAPVDIEYVVVED